MKHKIIIIIALIWIGQSAFAQVKETEKTSEENKSSKNQIIESQKDTVNNTNIEQKVAHVTDNIYYSEKEWKKIKRQIRRNKKRITSGNEIHSSKVLDTIYLEIKISKTNSQITDW